MHYFYIIYSENLDKYYTGESPDPKHRLNQHNTHYFKMNFTKAASDWILKLSYETVSKKEALTLELFVKRMKSKKFIEKVVKDPSVLSEIIKRAK